MGNKQDFSGTWQFCHWYPSVDDASEEKGEYTMTAHHLGDELVLESADNPSKKAYLFIRIKIDGRVATGTWHENADMDGPFEGAQYNGAGQLIISEAGDYMDGMWAGAGYDRAAGKLRIYTGRWELKRAGKD